MISTTLVNQLSSYFLLTVVVGIPTYAAIRGVLVFDAFVDGAKESIGIIVNVVPVLVGMLVAIGMFRASGGLDWLATSLAPILQMIGMPADILPLALVRPLSGGAANGILAEIIHHHGGDAFVSHLAATIMGSTETTFFVVAIYFGAQGIRQTRYAIPVGLAADATGILAAIVVCHALLPA